MITFSMVVDDSVEAVAASIVERCGLDLADVTLARWRRMAEIGRIPFDLDGEPNEENLEALRASYEIVASGGDGRGPETIDDVIAALRP